MIGILTDSTSDLPTDLISTFNISVIPMIIKINGEHYLDRINLTSDIFYQQISNADCHPETDPPSVADFISRYAEMLLKYDEIISIHVGSSFSNTVHHAVQAVNQGRKLFFSERLKAKNYKPFKIKVIDSKSVSIGVGLLVCRAAMMVQKKIQFTKLADSIQDSAEKVRVIFTPKDLSYLKRSKRLTGIKYFIASLAGLKPLIQVTNGNMDKFSTSRGFSNAADAIVKEVYAVIKNPLENQLAVGYAGMSMNMGENILAQKLSDGFKYNSSFFQSIIGPTIGAHCGPETVAAAFFTE